MLMLPVNVCYEECYTSGPASTSYLSHGGCWRVVAIATYLSHGGYW